MKPDRLKSQKITGRLVRDELRCQARSINEAEIRVNGNRCNRESCVEIHGARLCFAHGKAVQCGIRTLRDVMEGRSVAK